MAQFVNTFALSTEQISSSEIGPLGMVAHRIEVSGQYFGRVHHGDIEVAQFELIVENEPGHGQADVDLSKLVVRPGDAQRKSARFKMSREGYAIFFVSTGTGGYSVTLEIPVGEEYEKREVVFDSRKLAENDLFVVTLVRPGLWSAHDRASSSTAEITVTYPEVGGKAYRPAEQAAVIKVEPKGMSPKSIKIGPGEGVVFHVATETASINVELLKPDDGKPKKGTPKPKGKRRVRWTNPRPQKP